MKVRYSYLPQQFQDADDLWQELRAFVATGDFTLGAPLQKFEREFAELVGTKHAVGVNSGTDAIKLSLKALGIVPGDEVITAANTFVATVGAICEIGATPVFVDSSETFCMNVGELEKAISPKTKAIVPVHFTGYMTDMREVMRVAEHRGIPVVEDACQAILGAIDGRKSGSWGIAGAFSLHPLKNINVWSDGGVIVTNNDALARSLRLLRNHGLSDRDTVEVLGFNSRLDTFQAVVGSWLIPKAHAIADARISNARYYDAEFSQIPEISVPPRPNDFKIVFHLYVVHAENRDKLVKYCRRHGVEAKVHYPVPIYRQAALAHLGYAEGDFPVADSQARTVISFPCDQHLSREEMDYVVSIVKQFYMLDSS